VSARALFPKGKEPRYVFEVLIGMLPEAALVFSHDGIGLKALDPSKTALFSLTFHASALEDYFITEEVKIGLVFTAIKDVIKRIGTTEKVEFEVDRERNRFSIYIYPKRGKEAGLLRRFSFPIINIAEEEVPEISLDFSASAELDAGAFDDVLSMMGEVSDWVQITVTPNSVVFRSAGEGGKAAEAELTQDSEALLSVSAGEAVSARYSLDMLKDISSKMRGASKRVKLELSANKPLRLTYEFSTGVLSAVIAPRVD